MNNESIVNSIKLLCSDKGITMGQLEKKVGLSQGLVSKWKDKIPSLDKIVAIADYFNVPVDKVIGRELKSSNVSSEDFVATLYKMTVNHNIEWEEHTKQIPKLETDNNFMLEDDGYDQKELFVASYNNGFFLLYCQYEEEKGNISDIDIQIYIRPDTKSKAVLQDINFKKAYQLWLYIHTNIYGTPDEVKAEELKNDFVSNNSKLNDKNYLSKETDLADIQKMVSSPEIIKLMELCNQPAFRELRETFNNPEIQNAIQIANKIQSYFDK